MKTKVLSNILDAQTFVQGRYATRLTVKQTVHFVLTLGKVVKSEFTG